MLQAVMFWCNNQFLCIMSKLTPLSIWRLWVLTFLWLKLYGARHVAAQFRTLLLLDKAFGLQCALAHHCWSEIAGTSVFFMLVCKNGIHVNTQYLADLWFIELEESIWMCVLHGWGRSLIILQSEVTWLKWSTWLRTFHFGASWLQVAHCTLIVVWAWSDEDSSPDTSTALQFCLHQ